MRIKADTGVGLQIYFKEETSIGCFPNLDYIFNFYKKNKKLYI